MGRLMTLTSDHTSVLGIVVRRFTSNHPVDLDRIARMRDDARQVCIDRPEICAQFKLPSAVDGQLSAPQADTEAGLAFCRGSLYERE
jgi:hypothetical protein